MSGNQERPLHEIHLEQMKKALEDPEVDKGSHLISRMTALGGLEEENITVSMDMNRKSSWTNPGDQIEDEAAHNEPENFMLIISPGGHAGISHQVDGGWTRTLLQEDEQRTLNAYVEPAIPLLRAMVEEIREEESKLSEEELDRMLAEEGTREAKREKFQELLRRTLVMAQSILEDLRILDEAHPGQTGTVQKRSTAERAFESLNTVAAMTGTKWEPLEG